MKAIIKEAIGNNGRICCYQFDSSEMFYGSDRRIKENEVFILSCDSCPDATYSSVVSFTEGIHFQIFKFIKDNGPCEIVIGDSIFFIDIRNKSETVVDKQFTTFMEAFAYCMMEDKRFWDENRFDYNNANRLADLH